MQVLYKMAETGAIDKNIANDLSLALAPYDGKDLPVFHFPLSDINS
jgi:hypothetical protein